MTTTRRRLSPEARRDELLDAAARLALEAGDPAAASLERVAEASGCSRNLAYRYFPNHASLLEALAERERAAVAARLMRVPFDAPFEDWFDAVVEAVMDLAEERGRLLLMLFEQSMFPRASQRRGVLIDVLVGKLVAAGVSADRAAIAGPILGSALLGAAGVVVSGAAPRSDVIVQLRRVAATLVA